MNRSKKFLSKILERTKFKVKSVISMEIMLVILAIMIILNIIIFSFDWEMKKIIKIEIKILIL